MKTIRCAAHVHSDWSFDGTWPLEKIVVALRRRGYDAVLMAEHSQSLDGDSWLRYRRFCAELSDESFTVVPGIEYRDADNAIHMPVWGDLPHMGDAWDIGELLERVQELGGTAIWAHPDRHDAWRRFDPAWAVHLSGIEVWNRKYDGWKPGSVALKLASEWALPGYASLDFHRRRQLFPLAMNIEIAGASSVESICGAVHGRAIEASFLRTPVARWSTGMPSRTLGVADRLRKGAAAVLR